MLTAAIDDSSRDSSRIYPLLLFKRYGFGPIDPPSRSSSLSDDPHQSFHATLMAMARVCEGGTIKDYNPEVMSEKLCFLAHKALREAPDATLVEAIRKHGWNGIEFEDPIGQRLAIREELNSLLDDAGVGFGFAADPTFGPASGVPSAASLSTSPPARSGSIGSASVRRRSQSLSSAGRPRPNSLGDDYLTEGFRDSSARGSRPRSTRVGSGIGRTSPEGGGSSGGGSGGGGGGSSRPLSRSGSASRSTSGRLRRRPSFNESIAVSALPNISGDGGPANTSATLPAGGLLSAGGGSGGGGGTGRGRGLRRSVSGNDGNVIDNPFDGEDRPISRSSSSRGGSASGSLRPVRVGSGRGFR